MSEVRVENITKRFGEIVVFDGFSCELHEGGLYLLSEPSGSGKTTLLRMLMGLDKPDSGSITGIPRLIGAVFQEDRLLTGLTVRKNIELVIPGKAPDPALTESHLAETGLACCADKTVSALSGGMKRRAAIVRAILYPCSLLLLDEPFAGLDADAIALTAAYILKHLDGRTCVIASHIAVPALSSAAEYILF